MSHATNSTRAPNVGAMHELRAKLERWLGRLVRRLFPHRHKWKVLELESRDGSLIYTVRDCQCGEREIKHAMAPKWTTFTCTKFSHLPCFEDWHREQYLNAVPRKPNTEPSRAKL